MNRKCLLGSGVPVLAVLIAGVFLVALIAAGPHDHDHAHKAKKHASRSAASFKDNGELIVPKDYRQWVFVGAPVTPHDMNDGKAAFPEFHNVYIDPASYAAYKATGKFPEGTVLIKELVTVGAKHAASGNGYFQGEFIGVEAAVKSAKHFPDEPGHWAYFSLGKFPKLAESAKAHPTASCNACHQAVATEDWVFTEFYPVLRAAKPGAATRPAK